MKKRRTFSPEQKTKVVLELLSEEYSLTEVAAKYEIQPAQITRWKTQFLKNASRAFNKEDNAVEKISKQHEAQVDELHRQLGQLSTELNWLKKKSKELGQPTEAPKYGGQK